MDVKFLEFYPYLEFYPDEDEVGYDGVHNGGMKGIKENAPDNIKEEFEIYLKEMEELKKQGIKL
jgi:hypothetical protein